MSNKLIALSSILLLSVLCILSLSGHATLLSILLMIIAYAKHKIYPIKKELLWYVLLCVGGAIVEMLLVNFGYAWSYQAPQLWGIPIWMALFWGVVGTTIIVLYDGLINR